MIDGDKDARIRKSFCDQAYWCDKLGSPFTAALCRVLAQRMDRGSDVGRAILDWEGDPGPILDNLPLRLVGRLHALVLRGECPELAALYPPNPTPDDEALWQGVRAALDGRSAALKSRLMFAPLSNEVGRAAGRPVRAWPKRGSESQPRPVRL